MLILAYQTGFKRFFGFKGAVKNLIREGRLEVDKSQKYAIDYLGKLAGTLETKRSQQNSSIWSLLSDTGKYDKKGAYIYGSVGSGKTMLMDLFFENVQIPDKSRFHYNQFMLQFHSELRKMRNEGSSDPIENLVGAYCKRMRLLCLDEFQVTDIADAMILRKLLSSFIDSGMAIVTTSNRHPDELYFNGIQRSSFTPCIELIKSSLEVINLSSETDYRMKKESPSTSNARFMNPINEDTSKLFLKLFKESCPDAKSFELQVMGRNLKIPQGTVGLGAKFSFQDLFVDAKSAADYIELSRSFKNIFVSEVPEFTSEMRNEIRRFITFIDQIYENKNELFIQSHGDIIENLARVKDQLPQSYDESFALRRTISRLKEIKG